MRSGLFTCIVLLNGLLASILSAQIPTAEALRSLSVKLISDQSQVGAFVRPKAIFDSPRLQPIPKDALASLLAEVFRMDVSDTVMAVAIMQDGDVCAAFRTPQNMDYLALATQLRFNYEMSFTVDRTLREKASTGRLVGCWWSMRRLPIRATSDSLEVSHVPTTERKMRLAPTRCDDKSNDQSCRQCSRISPHRNSSLRRRVLVKSHDLACVSEEG